MSQKSHILMIFLVCVLVGLTVLCWRFFYIDIEPGENSTQQRIQSIERGGVERVVRTEHHQDDHVGMPSQWPRDIQMYIEAYRLMAYSSGLYAIACSIDPNIQLDNPLPGESVVSHRVTDGWYFALAQGKRGFQSVREIGTHSMPEAAFSIRWEAEDNDQLIIPCEFVPADAKNLTRVYIDSPDGELDDSVVSLLTCVGPARFEDDYFIIENAPFNRVCQVLVYCDIIESNKFCNYSFDFLPEVDGILEEIVFIYPVDFDNAPKPDVHQQLTVRNEMVLDLMDGVLDEIEEFENPENVRQTKRAETLVRLDALLNDEEIPQSSRGIIVEVVNSINERQ